jgi:hypothetical protein
MPVILRRPKKKEPLLYAAARMVLEEHDNLVDSIPFSLHCRLEAIALELIRIEDRL